MHYAINISDMTAIPAPMRGVLLTSLIDRQIINAEPGRFDGMAAHVKADIAPVRFASAVLFLRKQGYNTGLLRVYCQQRQRWERLHDAALTALAGDSEKHA